MDDERIISTRQLSEDETENSLRPKSMADYIGQKKAKENLSIYIQEMCIRDRSMNVLRLNSGFKTFFYGNHRNLNIIISLKYL